MSPLGRKPTFIEDGSRAGYLPRRDGQVTADSGSWLLRVGIAWRVIGIGGGGPFGGWYNGGMLSPEIETMIRLPAISKNMPRGQPFRKGISGNLRGRPKRTPEEVELIKACRTKAPEALEVIEGLMRNADNDRVRLAAAQFIIERGFGKAPEKIEIFAAREEGPLPWCELSPREAYMKLVRGEVIDDVVEDEAGTQTDGVPENGLEGVLASL